MQAQNKLTEQMLTYPVPGLNALERDWYFDRYISNLRETKRLQETAAAIAAVENLPVGKIVSMMGALTDDGASVNDRSNALEQIGSHLGLIMDLQHKKEVDVKNSAYDLAKMILVSRWPEQAFKTSLSWLPTMGVEITQAEVDGICTGDPRINWLKSSARWALAEKIISQLPSQIVNELAEYARYELREGDEGEEVDPDRLGKLETEVECISEQLKSLSEKVSLISEAYQAGSGSYALTYNATE